MLDKIKDITIIFALIVLMIGMISALTKQDTYFSAQSETLYKVSFIYNLMSGVTDTCFMNK